MKPKRFLTAERKAISYILGAMLMLGLAAVTELDLLLVHAQEAPDENAPPPPPPPGGPHGGDRRDDDGPGGRRGEMRKMFREEMRERFRGGAEGGGPGGPGGGPGEGQGGRGRVGRFLDVVQSYQTAVQDPHQAVGLAALGIKDHYRRSGKPLEAVKELEDMLAQSSDQKMRNIFLFIIKQIYEEERDSAKFLETSRRIVKENLGSKAK